MNIHVDYEIALQLLISFCIGSAIGIEREYNSKAAGLRTMIMICLGSTIFTEISMNIGGTANPDRLAASIVTGVGFLGAGVIFKEGVSITGITTATTIWICAALGTAVGSGEYFVAIVGSLIVLTVLVVLGRMQSFIEHWHQTRTYRITYRHSEGLDGATELEKVLKKSSFKFIKRKDYKDEKGFTLIYEVSGSKAGLEVFDGQLKADPFVTSYLY